MNAIKPGLPQIGMYPLPQATDLPASKVSWQLDTQRAALLVHDMQDYFLRPYDLNINPMADVINHITRLIDKCRSKGIPVFYTAQEVKQQRCDRGLQADFWGAGMQDPENHQKIYKDLQPIASDYVLTKHRYSAFQRSNLETMMKSRGRDQLLICGVYAHIGCLLTAGDAFMRDIEPFFIADAVADFSHEKHMMAVKYVADVCGVACMSTQVEAWL